MIPTDFSPLIISLKTSLAATGCALLLGVLTAAGVARLKGIVRIVLDALFTLPMVLPPTVLGFFLLVLFGRNSPLGIFLLKLGFRVIFSWQATVIAATVVAFPLVYRTVLASIENIDPCLTAAARTLGLSELTIFTRITLPLCRSALAAGTILGFARALGEFGATLMIAGNIPGRTQTLPLAIFFASESGNMRLALFWVLIIVSISFAVTLAVNAFTGKKR